MNINCLFLFCINNYNSLNAISARSVHHYPNFDINNIFLKSRVKVKVNWPKSCRFWEFFNPLCSICTKVCSQDCHYGLDGSGW